MAFFKFRKGGDEQTAPAAQPESVEVLRRRAKNRLIGKQPRPVAVDLPIEIPDKNKVLPLAAPPAPAAASETPAAPSAAASGVVTQAEPAPAEKPATKPEPRSVKPEAKPEAKAEIKKVEAPKPAAENRYVVQVGSFAEETRAREARAKLERAGLKNYTQAVETKEGKRIRVRAGPFASKAEAERAAEKIKKLDLPASVLSL